MSYRNSVKKLNRKQFIERKRRKQSTVGRGRKRPNGPYSLSKIKTVPIITRCMRYQSQSNDTQYVFRNTDMLAMMAFTDSTTTGYSVISAVKIQRIKLQVLPDASDLSGTAVFTWLGQFAPNNEETVMFMNAVPASLTARPLEGSVASWWLTDTTDTQDIFEINLSTAVPFILDIQFEYCLPNDSSQTSALTFVGATAGRFLYPSIPRSMSAGTRLLPVGLPTG